MAIKMVGYNCGGSIDAHGNYNDGGKIHIAKNKKGTFKAAATKAGESGPEFANKVLSAPEGEYSPALRKKANFAKNFAYRNEGGDVPRYDENGELTNGPYERSGPEFDTVPTMLTEGEFVVNAASAHKFAPIIEAINDWKVGEPVPKIQHLNLGDEVKKAGGVVDKLGQAANVLKTGSINPNAATLRLLNNADARKNARKGAQARAAAARLNGGIQSLGAGFDNAVAQAASAGFQTNSLGGFGSNGYTPANFSSKQAPDTNFRSQLQAIGQGEQEAANADNDYYKRLDEINTRETDDIAEQEKEQKKLDAELKVIKEIRYKAKQAYDLVDTAIPALKVLKDSRKLKKVIDDIVPSSGSGILNKGLEVGAIFGANTSALQFLLDQQADIALNDAVESGTVEQDAATAARNIVSLTTQITTQALKAQGPGVKTDFDFVVAERAVANLKDNPETIKSSFKLIIEDADRTLSQAGNYTNDEAGSDVGGSDAVGQGGTTPAVVEPTAPVAPTTNSGSSMFNIEPSTPQYQAGDYKKPLQGGGSTSSPIRKPSSSAGGLTPAQEALINKYGG